MQDSPLSVAALLDAYSRGESALDRLDVEVLLCDTLNKNRAFLYTWPDYCLQEEEAARFRAKVSRRQAGEPVAYITGYREFWSLSLACDASTLIPRPETELIVEWALQNMNSSTTCRVLDLGCGTGAIALAIASERANWRVRGADFSPQAVALAQRNAERLGLQRVQFQQGSWYQAVGEEQYDLIVSNPPYIDPEDPHLQQGDVRYEPRSALIAENHGLADIEEITRGAIQHLDANGWLAIEHGYDQQFCVQNIFTNAGFNQVRCLPDLAGLPRVTVGCAGKGEHAL